MAPRRVVVPLDGSEFGERALPWALSLAGPTGELCLLNAVYTADPAYFYDQHEAKVAAQAEEYLDAVAKRVSDRPGPVSIHVATGRPGPTIAHYATSVGADAIAMTSHGRGPVSRLWMGSAADNVMRESEVPVLVVRPDEVDATTAELPDRVMILLDGSVQAERALTAPALLGLPPTARIVLLRVVTTPVTAMPPSGIGTVRPRLDASALEEHRTAATNYLATARKWLAVRGYRNVAEDVQTGVSVAATALERAKELDTRLIALTTHGRGGIARLVMGSIADKVIRSGGPLILVFGRSD